MKLTNSYLTMCFIFICKISSATILYVPSQYITIQLAIDSSLNGDTILVAIGTYSGSGNYNIDFAGKKVLLQSVSGATNTIIDCLNNGRGFYFQTNEDSTSIVDGFTIQNGTAPGDYGGGFSCFWSSPLIKNCIINNNSSERGGGISCRNSSAKIRNCTISYNKSTWAGGIYLSAASIVLENSEISHDSSGYEGGIAVDWNSTMIIVGSTINNNISGYVGGVEIYYGSNVVMTNSYIQNNADVGINITNGSSLNMTNCLISDNLSDGLWASAAGQINIINSSIVFNNNRGIYSQSSTFNIKNSILYGNTVKQIYLWSAPLPFIEFTDIENRLTGGIVGAINWGNGNLDVYPDFVDTVLKDYHLISVSQCNGVGTLAGTPSNDLDYNVRPMPAASNPDLGAYELNQPASFVFESSLESNIKFYPNPFTSKLNIQVSNNSTLEISFYDIASRKILQQQFTNSVSLNTEQLAKGVYLYEVRNKNGVIKKGKVVKD